MNLTCIPILSSHSLSNPTLVSEVVKKGIFYLEIPPDCKKYVNDALKFCYQFPHDEEIKKYSDGNFGGYHAREHDQIESFYVERKDWGIVLPASLQELACKMDILAKDILKVILLNTEIPEIKWNEGTGNLTQDEGQIHLSFNHYRPEKDTVGIKTHRDFGFVSILFVEKAGLEALYNGEWVGVPPLNNHFIVILGKAFEILINDIKKVTAAWHRVRQLSEERVSFAITCDNNSDSSVKRYSKTDNNLEIVHHNYQNYLAECFREVYISPDILC